MRRTWLLTVTGIALVALAGGAVYGVASNEEAVGVARSAVKEAAMATAGVAKAAAAVARSAANCDPSACVAKSASLVLTNGDHEGCPLEALSAGAGCSFSRASSKPAVVAKGTLTGNFDPALSSACEGACAIRTAFKEAEVVAQPGAQIEDLTQCPVSGVIFRVTKGNAAVAHDGETFFTCCGGCAGRLQANPQRYLQEQV